MKSFARQVIYPFCLSLSFSLVFLCCAFVLEHSFLSVTFAFAYLPLLSILLPMLVRKVYTQPALSKKAVGYRVVLSLAIVVLHTVLAILLMFRIPNRYNGYSGSIVLFYIVAYGAALFFILTVVFLWKRKRCGSRNIRYRGEGTDRKRHGSLFAAGLVVLISLGVYLLFLACCLVVRMIGIAYYNEYLCNAILLFLDCLYFACYGWILEKFGSYLSVHAAYLLSFVLFFWVIVPLFLSNLSVEKVSFFIASPVIWGAMITEAVWIARFRPKKVDLPEEGDEKEE